MSDNVLQTPLAVHEQVQTGALSGYAVIQVDLRRIELSRRTLDDVTFRKSCLEFVPAEGVTCRDVLFEASRMRGLSLKRGLLTATRIMNCEGHELNLTESCINGLQVFDTPLSNARFSNARLDDCVFQSAELYGARFDSALLVHCRFSDPRMENASLNRAVFRRALLIDVDLRGANLHGADFEEAVCIKVDLRDTNLVRANLEGATFVACDMAGSVR